MRLQGEMLPSRVVWAPFVVQGRTGPPWFDQRQAQVEKVNLIRSILLPSKRKLEKGLLIQPICPLTGKIN
ncbi:hypothetical protein [Paenibacillus graminis]|uniref:hypothetical protein n=1 Tax=Paenibacillus graminis TaxID=189425 RepID=UPI002DBF39E6|nr:hypothetical protein [Paenibacillus graminis]MEC0170890.1 hypothetical protein [Paenibacillus graminis]